MAKKIDTLKAEIAEMEEVANNPGTPDDVKKALAPAIKNAKAQLDALTPSSPAKKQKAAPAPAKPAPVAQPVVKKSDASKPSSLKDCQDLLEKYQDKKKTDKKRVQKRAEQGKPPTLTPSEVVKKTATSVKAKVIEIKKADSKLPASEVVKITNGIISTIKGTLSGMASAVTKKAFLSDIINELRKIERNLPAAAMHGMILAAGGRTKNATNRDRMFQSQEEWEKDYQRKGQPGRRYMADGGNVSESLLKSLNRIVEADNGPGVEKITASNIISVTREGMSKFINVEYGDMSLAMFNILEIPVSTSQGLFKLMNSHKAGAYMEHGGQAKDDVWTFGQGSIKLNGEPVYQYEFNRDSDSFWVPDDSGSGQKSFETGEELIEWYKKKHYSGNYEHGGETIAQENAEMLQSQIKSIKHHSEELSAVVGDTPIEPWVLARATRAASDLSDITHYLDGVVKKKYERGGMTPSQGSLFESGGSTREYLSSDQVKGYLEQDGYNIHNDTQLNAIAAIEGYKYDRSNNKWYFSDKKYSFHEYKEGGEVSELVSFDSMYDGKVDAYESTIQKGLYYYVTKQDNNFIVMAEAVGYPASEAADDWFTSNESAMEMAKDLAEGKANDYFAKGGTNYAGFEYQVELESRFNPDRSKNDYGNVVIKPKKYWVKNFAMAREKALDFIKENGLGGGNFPNAPIYKDGKKVASISYNGRIWDETTGGEYKEGISMQSDRIAKMVKNWNEEGRAFSNLSIMDEDGEFFESVGVSPDKMGITSQTGNDIVYYDTDKYESDNAALRKIKKMAIGGIIEHGINKGDLIVDVYKDYGIIAEGGDKNIIVAWDPNVGSRYYAGLDESKPLGQRDKGLSYEDKIKDAKKYIDFLDNQMKVKAGLRRAEKGMQLSSGHNYPKVQLKGYDNHGSFWYVVDESDNAYKLVFEEKIDHYEETKGTPNETFYTEWEPKSEYEPYSKFAKGGGIGEEKIPVPSNFVVEGLDGHYPGYSFGDLWNGFEVPYFRLHTAKQIAKDSFQGNDETHLVYDEKKNVFVYHEKESDGSFLVYEIEPFVFRLNSVETLDLFPIGSYNWAWEKKAKSEPVKPSNNKPLQTIEYKGEEITHSEHFPDLWFVGDEEFKSLAAAKKHIDGGSKPSARMVNAYRHGAMKKGGNVAYGETITKKTFDKLYPESKFSIDKQYFFVKDPSYKIPTHNLDVYFIVTEKGSLSSPVIYKKKGSKFILTEKLPEPTKK